MNTVPQSDEQLRQEVSARYARIALQVLGAPSESASLYLEVILGHITGQYSDRAYA